MVRLNDVESFEGWPQRLSAALDLWEAAGDAYYLRRELPYVARRYSGWPVISAYKRLEHVARNAADRSLKAFTIMHNEPTRPKLKAVGMATAQVALPKPNPTEMGQGIELSFWTSPRTPQDLGRQVLNLLIAKVKAGEVPGSAEDDSLWMVTLPDHINKASVCSAIGMVAVEKPQPYYIDDGVNESRQLWVLGKSLDNLVGMPQTSEQEVV